MATTRKEIQDALAKMDAKVVAESQELIAELMSKTVLSGIRPKTALRLSDEVMEGIYGYAYNLYNRGLYSEAANIFRLLMMLDYSENKYMMGLGACLHMLKEYENAIGVYTMVSLMGDQNPLPHYHCADCYLKLDDATDASFELKMAVEKAGDRKKYKVLVERCQLMMESLKDQVAVEQEELKRKVKETKQKLREKKAKAQAAKAAKAKE